VRQVRHPARTTTKPQENKKGTNEHGVLHSPA
jgi:hypothetical protein